VLGLRRHGVLLTNVEAGSGMFYDGKAIHTTCLRVHADK
jgi:hypothetical protein